MIRRLIPCSAGVIIGVDLGVIIGVIAQVEVVIRQLFPANIEYTAYEYWLVEHVGVERSKVIGIFHPQIRLGIYCITGNTVIIAPNHKVEEFLVRIVLSMVKIHLYRP